MKKYKTNEISYNPPCYYPLRGYWDVVIIKNICLNGISNNIRIHKKFEDKDKAERFIIRKMNSGKYVDPVNDKITKMADILRSAKLIELRNNKIYK